LEEIDIIIDYWFIGWGRDLQGFIGGTNKEEEKEDLLGSPVSSSSNNKSSRRLDMVVVGEDNCQLLTPLFDKFNRFTPHFTLITILLTGTLSCS